MKDLGDLQDGLNKPGSQAGAGSGGTGDGLDASEGGNAQDDAGLDAGPSEGDEGGTGGEGSNNAGTGAGGGAAGSFGNGGVGPSGDAGVDVAGAGSGGVAGNGASGADAGANGPLVIPPGTFGVLPVSAQAIAIDGDLSEWDDAGEWLLGSDDYVPVTSIVPTSDADLSASVRFRYTSSALYIAIAVTDDTQTCNFTAGGIWQGDGVQLAFALPSVAHDTEPYDWEFGYALMDANGPEDYRWLPMPASGTVDGDFAIVRTGTVTVYEILITASQLGVSELVAGLEMTGEVQINEHDGTTREGWLQTSAGISSAPKSASAFLSFSLL